MFPLFARQMFNYVSTCHMLVVCVVCVCVCVVFARVHTLPHVMHGHCVTLIQLCHCTLFAYMCHVHMRLCVCVCVRACRHLDDSDPCVCMLTCDCVM